MKRKPWTDERLNEALKRLEKGQSTAEVCDAMQCTEDSLVSAFRRAELGSPASHQPLEQHQAKKDARAINANNKQLIELLAVERDKNKFLQALGQPRKPLAIKAKEKGHSREMTALVLASDWHVEETVSPIKVQGRNKYSLAIAALRMQRFWQGIVDLIQHHRAGGIVIRDLVLWLGGDLITGYIHEEMLVTSALSPIETVLWLAPRLKAGIVYLLDELDLANIKIPCDIGNHGRTTKFRNITTGPETSYEYGLYCQLAREFADDKRVEFDTSASNDHYTDIYGFRLHTTHGDSLRYAGGVGGLTIPLLKAVSAWDADIPCHYHAIGHFHTSLDVDKAIGNGSMVGWNPFAKWIKAKYNPRDLSQHFSLVDKEKGRCHSTVIWVSSWKDEKRFWSKDELATCKIV